MTATAPRQDSARTDAEQEAWDRYRDDLRELALTRQRVQAAGHRDRADHRRVRPLDLGPPEGLREDAAVERRAVRDEHAALEQLGEIGQRRLGRRRLVDHRLRYPGERLDASRQRLAGVDERLPAFVQLAAAHQHGADLRQLAGLACETVRLGVDDEEFGGCERGVRIHPTLCTPDT